MLPCSMSQIPSLFTRYCDLITCNLIAAVPPHPTGYPRLPALSAKPRWYSTGWQV